MKNLRAKLSDMRCDGAPAYDTLLPGPEDDDGGPLFVSGDQECQMGWRAALDELEAWLLEGSA